MGKRKEKKVRIGIIQLACSSNTEENINRTEEKIKQLSGQGAQIICLQELFSSLYFCETEDHDHFRLAESVPGPLTERFSKLAKQLDIVIILPLFEKTAHGIYFNTVAVLDADGRYLGKYRKTHIPDDPGFYEKFYFTPGNLGYKVFKTKFGNLGTLICWDQWYPEAARITALMGADILFYPTAIGWASHQDDDMNRKQHQAWQMIQRSHAVANGIPVVTVNRIGKEGEMIFWGGSFISDAFGELIFGASHREEIVHVQEIDIAHNDEYRVHWPFFRDRRIDTYGPIVSRIIEEDR